MASDDASHAGELTSSSITLPPLQRDDLMAEVTCQASNTLTLPPVSATVSIDMIRSNGTDTHRQIERKRKREREREKERERKRDGDTLSIIYVDVDDYIITDMRGKKTNCVDYSSRKNTSSGVNGKLPLTCLRDITDTTPPLRHAAIMKKTSQRAAVEGPLIAMKGRARAVDLANKWRVVESGRPTIRCGRGGAMPPLTVKLEGLETPLQEGVATELVCEGAGSRPPAAISWRWNHVLLERSPLQHIRVAHKNFAEGNISQSTLTVTPKLTDEGTQVSCRVENARLPLSMLEDGGTITVHCIASSKYDVSWRSGMPAVFSQIRLANNYRKFVTIEELLALQPRTLPRLMPHCKDLLHASCASSRKFNFCFLGLEFLAHRLGILPHTIEKLCKCEYLKVRKSSGGRRCTFIFRRILELRPPGLQKANEVSFGTDAPRLLVEAGQNMDLTDIKEGADVYFECSVQASPPTDRLSWWHNVSTNPLYWSVSVAAARVNP
ncbi:CD80-like immunoglobulin C2-set [Trinorchestia longiramus]|nr:CD80-like immunoglobulin C2-set [Trinorchestia longiramus]